MNIIELTIKSVLSVFLIVFTFTSLTYGQQSQKNQVNWLSWSEALELHESEPKKMYINISTEWCGWCKKMDKTTFTEPEVVAYLNANYYAIKFDAEQTETILYNGNKFIFRPGKKRGVHELALSLLNGQLGYPGFVMLDEEHSRILISPGYKEAPAVMKELRFGVDEAYKYSSFEDYTPKN